MQAIITLATGYAAQWLRPTARAGRAGLLLACSALLGASAAHATTSNCPAEAQGIYNVCSSLTATGDGSSGNPWVGWESDLNTRPVKTEIYFPAGVYRQSTTIDTKVGWTVRGAGMNSSQIVAASGFNGAMFKSTSSINASTSVFLRIEDLQLISNNLSSASSGIDVIGATYVTIKRVLTYGFAVGLWLDQAELADVEECSFLGTSQSVAGIYLVSGGYHTTGAAPMYTNRIGIRKNQFNGTGQPNFVAVYDEGGVAHMIRDNNFQGGKHAIWFAGGRDVLIEGNEIEETSAEPISINVSIPNESSTESTLNLAIRNNTISPPEGYSSIVFPAPVSPNAISGAEVTNNLMATHSGDPVSIAGINYVRNLIAYSNNNFSSSTSVPISSIGPGAFQVLGSMSISTTGALAVVPPTPPVNTYYLYIDPTTGELRAKGSSGSTSTLAVP